MMTNWFEELMSQQRRSARRHIEPRLVAFYWDGVAPQPRHIRNVSAGGFYLLTEERWYPGTLITMTLQRTEKSGDGSKSSIAVQARVIRCGKDGVAVKFVFPQAEQGRQVRSIIAQGVAVADKKTLELFLQPLWVNPIGLDGGTF
jgi:type II secretory pathway component PulM